MSKKYLIDETTLVDIADKLRFFKAYDNPDLQDTKYTPKSMQNGVDETYNIGYGHGYKDGDFDGYNDGYMIGYDEGEQKGYSDGEKQGYQTGYAEGEETGFSNGVTTGTAEGYADGYEAGKQAEYDAFWDAFQHKGKRENYQYAFFSYEWEASRTWNDTNFTPKYDICPNNAQFMLSGLNVKNLSETIQKLGIKLDLSKAITLRYFLNRTTTKKVPVIDGSGVTESNGYERIFSYSSIEEIEKFIVADNGKSFSSTFAEATKLHTITFEGVIGRSISFAHSPLTIGSMISVITHLKDYSGTSNAGDYTLTLKDSCKTLMADQGTIAEFGGKTYDQYITDIGWNLA